MKFCLWFVLFVNKKNQKNFVRFPAWGVAPTQPFMSAAGMWSQTREAEQSLFASFSSEKEVLT
jgi:hypothetical protein